MKRILALVLVAVFVCSLFVSGCGGGSSSGGNTPDGAAKDFYTGLMEGNESMVKAVVCDKMKNDKTTWDGLVAAMAMTKAVGAKADLSGLKFTVTNQASDKATVVLSGMMKITMLGQTQEQPVDPSDSSIPTIKQGDKWVVCQ